MQKHRKKLVLLLVLLATCGLLWTQNNLIDVEEIAYSHPQIPAAFSGYRIAHVSDLHNKSFGNEQRPLLAALQKMRPDIIVITGDLIDTAATEHALTFARHAVTIAPVYYVTGNHELRYAMQDKLGAALTALGVHVLQDETVWLSRGGERISLSGVNDPAYFVPITRLAEQSKQDGDEGTPSTYAQEHALHDQRVGELEKMLLYLGNEAESTSFSMLLAHHPEYLSLYQQAGFSLVFAGHAHGGQIRLPFVGPILSPGQGMLPAHTSGLYKAPLGSTDLIVSRGLGNSAFPQRIHNRPHLLLVTLEPEADDV